MTTNRRDFVKWLALIAAGASARPEQVEAFEKYYEVNTPQVAEGLVAIDEILLCGMATSSMPTLLEIADPQMRIGVNLFGGIMRWVAQPDQKIIRAAHVFTWQLSPRPKPHEFEGHIAFVDQNMKRHYQPIAAGSLV